jgi:uncharacterized membrane protein
MSLTYQPFSDTPVVDRLASDLRMNVSDPERLASGVLGAAVASAALAERGFARLALLIIGGALVRRGITGHCPCYAHTERDTRHQRAGVAGNRGIRVEESIDIRCEADALYDFWKTLDTLPLIFSNVLAVEKLGPRRSRWTVAGPAGKSIHWDAEVINDHDGRLIAWQSLAGAAVANAGSVRFEPGLGGVTRVKVAFEYDPPAGAVGAFLAQLFGASPRSWLKQDLETFRQFAERELKAGGTGA